jgi:Family of unknown function (DUF5946)
MFDVFPTGYLTLQKLKTGGHQHLVVQYQQQVNVPKGGQAVVAAKMKRKTGRRVSGEGDDGPLNSSAEGFRVSGVCHECGAVVPGGGSCRDHFHALLLLESEIPGGPGETAHFLAVSCYALHHPEGMNFTAEALAGSRRQVADRLAGVATMEQIRSRVRSAVDGPRRVTRRAGDAVVRWRVSGWPMTVSDVLAGGVEGYAGRVEQWAWSIVRTLDATEAEQALHHDPGGALERVTKPKT